MLMNGAAKTTFLLWRQRPATSSARTVRTAGNAALASRPLDGGRELQCGVGVLPMSAREVERVPEAK